MLVLLINFIIHRLMCVRGVTILVLLVILHRLRCVRLVLLVLSGRCIVMLVLAICTTTTLERTLPVRDVTTVVRLALRME